MRILLSILLLASGLSAVAEKTRVLFLTQSQGFMHQPVKRGDKPLAPAEEALTALGKECGLFQVDCTQDASTLTKAKLDEYDIVAFYTTGDLPIAEGDFDYFVGDWLREKGHGFIGFHSATDTYKNKEAYWDLVGGSFDGHPWGANTLDVMTVHDTSHPAMAPYDAEFAFRDEIYQYTNWQPEKVKVLMSLNMAKCQVKRPYHVPVAWVKEVGSGKMFYTNLGHRLETWKDEQFKASIVGAVKWIRGDVEGDATPNPELSRAVHEASVKAANEAGMTKAFLEEQERKRAERRRKAQKN